MKKYLLSFSVVFSFLAYSIHQRVEKSEARIAVPPNVGNSSLDTPEPTESNVNADGLAPIITPTPILTKQSNGLYKNGIYAGDIVDAYYGNVQIKTTISGGRITDVVFLEYPKDRNTSIEINTQAIPYLKQEAIQVQNSQVDIVSGATSTSIAFRQSLGSALQKAK
ncbi:FMN-binding protein [Candidatus Woesebacteria bacterium]|nr:FMN-binding protein [Candidatus Woesebacteria bacterium]